MIDFINNNNSNSHNDYVVTLKGKPNCLDLEDMDIFTLNGLACLSVLAVDDRIKNFKQNRKFVKDLIVLIQQEVGNLVYGWVGPTYDFKWHALKHMNNLTVNFWLPHNWKGFHRTLQKGNENSNDN